MISLLKILHIYTLLIKAVQWKDWSRYSGLICPHISSIIFYRTMNQTTWAYTASFIKPYRNPVYRCTRSPTAVSDTNLADNGKL